MQQLKLSGGGGASKPGQVRDTMTWMVVMMVVVLTAAQIVVETHMTDTALRGTPAAPAPAPAAAAPVADGSSFADGAAATASADARQDAAQDGAAAPAPPDAAAAAAAAAAGGGGGGRLPRKVNKKFSPTEHDSFSGPGGVCMTLEEVQQRIAADAECVPAFWREKYEADAARNWDIFYSINSRNFFKVRSATAPQKPKMCNVSPGPPVPRPGVRGAASEQHAGALRLLIIVTLCPAHRHRHHRHGMA